MRTIRFLALVSFMLCPPHAVAESLSPTLTGGMFEYNVQSGDYLIKIGARFGVEATALSYDNSLEYDALLMPEQKLVINNLHIVPQNIPDGILINLPQRMLYYFRAGELMLAYPVGLGKPSWPTPTGEFSVISKIVNKAWRVPKSIQEEMRREGHLVKTEVPPGPKNPLGKHWLGLSIASIGIHGTIAPASIYKFQSHGCIRLHPDDIEKLFSQVALGETGSIIYAPLLLTESEGKVFLEVHQDIYKKSDVSLAALQQLANEAKLSDDVDWELAKYMLDLKDGIAHEITLRTSVFKVKNNIN